MVFPLEKLNPFSTNSEYIMILFSKSLHIMSSDSAVAPAKKYRTHYIRSWHEYQRVTPSHLHSIEHYNSSCEEHAKLYDDGIMVLRDKVTNIKGYYYCTGWAAQNCADTDGYVDVRTGKEYTLEGDTSFFKEIR